MPDQGVSDMVLGLVVWGGREVGEMGCMLLRKGAQTRVATTYRFVRC